MSRGALCAMALATVSVIAACGDPADRDAASTPTPDAGSEANFQPTSDELDAVAQVAQRLCSGLDACLPAMRERYFADGAACADRVAAVYAATWFAPGTTRGAGDVRTCAEQIAAPGSADSPACADIARWWTFAPKWDRVCRSQGTFPDGSACRDSGQCASGSCSFHMQPEVMARLPGIESPLARPDPQEACGRCDRARQPGDDCTAYTCDLGVACRLGSCVGYSELSGNCNDSAQLCQPDLFCSSALGGTCQGRRGLHKSCLDVSFQPHDWCGLELACNAASSECDAVESAAAGEKCGAVAGGTLDCERGLRCKLSTLDQGECVPVPRDGESCAGSWLTLPARPWICEWGGDCVAGICRTIGAEACLPEL